MEGGKEGRRKGGEAKRGREKEMKESSKEGRVEG